MKGTVITWCLLLVASASCVNAFNGIFDVIIGATGKACINECKRRNGSKYSTCQVLLHDDRLNDYCSEIQGASTSGYNCKSSCEKKGFLSYYSTCSTNNYWGWDYCSSSSEGKQFEGLASNGYFCKSKCFLYRHWWPWGSYYNCQTGIGYGYCSPREGYTYTNEPCRDDHFCGKHNKDYYWCFTRKGWDYCSPVETCPRYTATNRAALLRPTITARPLSGEFCRIHRTPSIAVVFRDDINSRNRMSTVYGDTVVRVQNLIAMWDIDGFSGRERPGTVFPRDNRRAHDHIDYQSTFEKDGARYTNVQVQVGGDTVATLVGRNTTFPPRYIRRAFLQSIERQKTIILDIVFVS